jgi:glycosyltransferase involved in cell wall biosynthesis
MRIGYVCTDPGIPVFGSKGSSVHVQAVLRVLLRRGMEVHLLAARFGGEVPAGLEGLHLHLLPPIGPGEAAARELAAQSSDAAVASVLTGLAGLDLVYERYALWGRTATTWAARNEVPSVLEVNAPLVDEQRAHRELHDIAGAEAVARTALTAAGTVACVSAGVAAWAVSAGSRQQGVITVPNGVDTEQVVPSSGPITASDATRFTVGFVGTLRPWHGIEVLVDAMALLTRADPSWRLLVVGGGPQAADLLRRAAQAGVEIELTGPIPSREVVSHLHRIDIATAPYASEERCYFSPLKVYEYLAAGLPVVASRAGQVPAALDHGRLGSLVPPGDPVALAGALDALRADTARRTALRTATRQAALEQHTWDAAVDRILSGAGLGVAL